MSRRRKLLVALGATLGGIVLLAAIAVVVLTRTDWGRERVRAFGVGRLAQQVAGSVSIGRLSGNLLTGATLSDVAIADSSGAPFLLADTLVMRYSLRSFLSKHLIFSDVRIVNPTIVLDQPPGGEWNFARIFPQDTTARPDTTPGFGSWVRFENMTIVNGMFTVRSAWTPPDSLTGAGRMQAIDAALAPGSRAAVVAVPGGYQTVSYFHDVHAQLPRMRLADPDSAARIIEVASLRATAYPFRPPAVDVRQLAGTFVFTGDSLLVDDLQLALPATRAAVRLRYALDDGGVRAGVRADPVAFEDLRWLRPDLPDGGGEIVARIARAHGMLAVDAQRIDLDVDGATLTGHANVAMGETLRLGATELAFANVDTRLIERLAPGRPLPVSGTGRGRLTLSGHASALQVDGWAEFRQRNGSTSRVVADGAVGMAPDGMHAQALRLRFEPLRLDLVRAFAPDLRLAGALNGNTTVSGSTAGELRLNADLVHVDPRAGRSRVRADGGVRVAGGFTARDLRLRMDPVQIAVLRAYSPNLPIAGTIGGSATVNGSTRTRIATVLDVVVNAETGTSHVIGTAAFTPGATTRFDVDLRMPRLSLATVGAFAPAAALHGSPRGTLEAHGTTMSFRFDTDLVFADGGSMSMNGMLSPGATLGYDVSARLDALDASVASGRAPATGLTGTLAMRGAGTDPATMDAVIAARLVDLRVQDVATDTTHVDVRLADGLAAIDRAHIRLASATADLEGNFGLTASRSGELRYRIDVDSLADFDSWIPPGDTVPRPPRPVLQQRRIAVARADSLRIYRETEVERAATGSPPPPTLQVDTVRPLPADSVAGSVHVEGVLAGNIERFDARGTMSAQDVVAAGVATQRAHAEYTVRDFGAPTATIELDFASDALLAAGFAFDSTMAHAQYAGGQDGGTGSADVALFQDPAHDYRLRSHFEFERDRRTLTLDELALRMDTVQWHAPHESVIRWAGTGVWIDALELHSTTGGRIFVDGAIPSEGDADLRVAVDDLPVSQITALLQDTLDADGVLDLDATLRGTPAAPRIDGASTLLGGSYGGRPLPDLHATFDYADTQLTAHAELTREARTLLVADAELPINLALRGVTGDRTLDRPLRIEAHMDSLPLEALPSFTDAVRDVRGRVRGQLLVLGTFEEPTPSGEFSLDLASLAITATGVPLRDVAGNVRIERGTLTLDSLVAYSTKGPIRAHGVVAIEPVTRPVFDLTIVADGARVLDNEHGRVRADADIAIAGALDSLTVTGDVEIVEGVLYAPEAETKKRATLLDDPAVVAAVDTAAVQSTLQGNPVLENLRLDLRVDVGRNTWVRNSGANVEIYTPPGADPLHVRMLPETGLSLDGVINAERGVYTFSGREFELTTGSVTFLPGTELDPLLQLSARHEVPRRGHEALAILIHVDGTLREPRVTVESTAQPPLSQSDLIAYLAFGRSSSSLLDLGDSGVGGDGLGGISALAQQQIAGLAVGSVIDEAMSNIQREGTRAGLDVFRIRPAPLPEEVALSGYLSNLVRGTEVVAGKYIGRRLFLAAQGRTTTETWPGLRAEYTTSGGFSLEATWEPRFLPTEPSLATDQEAATARAFGTFLFWQRRF